MRIFDALKKKKVTVVGYPQQMRIFLCGPTVYDLCHLGHARVLCFYDFMARYLAYKGFHPIAVVNITDIDPKISAKARRIGVTTSAVSDRYMNELLLDLSLLEINKIFLLARVSDYVDASKRLIKRLLHERIAYVASGNVYLDVRRITRYGELSGISYDKLKDLRIDIAPGKHNPSDTLLWNSGDFSCQQFFDPDFGRGIPWWHIQDSSVAMSIFEGSYDIHGGGVELIYPHHETHLGQLRVLTGITNPVNCWTHVGLVTVHGNKMSNSLSNTLKVRELLRDFMPNVIKLYLLSKHYREDLSFSRAFLEKYVLIDERISDSMVSHKTSNSIRYSNKIFAGFQSHLDNDFDTPKALGLLLEGITNGIDKYILSKMISIFGLQY